MIRPLLASIFFLIISFVSAPARAQQPAPPPQQPLVPSLLVTGRGEAFARPDRAVVRLGAWAQADKAADAQDQTSQRVAQVLEKLKELGIPNAQIQTVGLTLGPVYDQNPQPGQVQPRIVGYQATNTIQVRLDDLAQIGQVIDTALAAGANHLEGVSFELQDDADQRREALLRAVHSARQKAAALEQATATRLVGIIEITEGGVDVIRPMMMQRTMEFAAGADTPVQPGQVRVEATVTIRYRLAGDGAAPLVR